MPKIHDIMKFDPHFSLGEVMTVGTILVGIVLWFATARADILVMKSTVERHEIMLNHIVETQKQLTENQASVTATLSGIRELIAEHFRTTVPSPSPK